MKKTLLALNVSLFVCVAAILAWVCGYVCVWRGFSALRGCLPAFSQDPIQSVELAEETPVRDDTSVIFHCSDGLHQCQLLSDHQIGQHQSG